MIGMASGEGETGAGCGEAGVEDCGGGEGVGHGEEFRGADYALEVFRQSGCLKHTLYELG